MEVVEDVQVLLEEDLSTSSRGAAGPSSFRWKAVADPFECLVGRLEPDVVHLHTTT